jgi:hypothetical protein
MQSTSVPTPAPFRVGDLISIETAAESIGASPSAARRWARQGLKVGNGPTIRLTHVYIGGRIKTQAAWVEEFLANVTRARSHTEPPVSVEQAARRERELAAVDRELDRELGPRDTLLNPPPKRRGRKPAKAEA